MRSGTLFLAAETSGVAVKMGAAVGPGVIVGTGVGMAEALTAGPAVPAVVGSAVAHWHAIRSD